MLERETLMEQYALLVPAGFEELAIKALSPHCPAPPVAPPPAAVSAGYGVGSAGTVTPLLVDGPLPPEALSCSLVSAPLALVHRSGAVLEKSLATAADLAAVISEAQWKGAIKAWSAHHPAKPGSDLSLRVATIRSGAKHQFTSKQLDAAIGSAVRLTPTMH